MLEWTICTKCGKVLDDSKTICPVCSNKTEKSNMEFLKNKLLGLLFLINTLDMDLIKDHCFEIKTHEKAVSEIVLDDLFKIFSYFTLADGIITECEMEFINELLDLNCSEEDIKKESFNPDEIPLSFVCLHELDLFAKNYDMCIESVGELFKLYKIFLTFLITSNGDLNPEVLEKCNSYMKTLESKIKDYLPQDGDVSVLFKKSEKHEKTHSLEEYLNELNKLIGLEKVKKDVNSLINLVQIRKIRQDRGITQPPMSLHLVFSGNPGTGKTTVARLLSKIYHEIGLLSKGHLIETDRSGLVGGYVGQTALKTKEVITEALGGILFIDEAYSLASASENDYGKEAIDTILKAMEDNRDDLIVIVAGYPELMDKFLNSNPGLESRFNKFIYFDDYSSEELFEIFNLMCNDANLSMDPSAEDYAKQYFDKMYEHKSVNFANGRAVRNFFEEVITAQANRLAPKSEITDEELNTLTYEDFLVEE